MRVKSDMTEYEFIEEIADNFLFDTPEEYEEAMRAGAKISDNAALMVGYEMAKGDSFAGPELNSKILDIMEQERPTPVVLAAVPIIRELMDGKPSNKEDAAKLLAACKEHPGAWSGLSIVLCADESLEQEVNDLMALWSEQSGA
ncbi:MAG: hypothetical protein FWH25_02950 [Syntrophorhabdaceae bacterium]|nr:hypothetical protein [Syntrophorhabdaceae bacterium]